MAKKQKAKLLDRLLDHVIDQEEADFIERLEFLLPNDTDCSEEIESKARAEPWEYDTEFTHLYTVAVMAKTAKLGAVTRAGRRVVKSIQHGQGDLAVVTRALEKAIKETAGVI